MTRRRASHSAPWSAARTKLRQQDGSRGGGEQSGGGERNVRAPQVISVRDWTLFFNTSRVGSTND